MMSRAFTRREKILMIVMAVLLLAILYYEFLYKPTEQAMVTYDTTDLETQLMMEQTKAATISQMQEAIDTMKTESTSLVPSYNNQKNEVAMMNDIFDAATDYNLTFSAPTADGDSVRRSVAVSFTASSYSAAEKIIQEIHDCQYRCLIQNIDISAGEGGRISSGAVSVGMNVIFFETTYQATTTAGLEESTNENTTSESEAQ